MATATLRRTSRRRRCLRQAWCRALPSILRSRRDRTGRRWRVIGVSVSLELWPWLTVAGLGAFHGLNPSMGWLFAVRCGARASPAGSPHRLARARADRPRPCGIDCDRWARLSVGRLVCGQLDVARRCRPRLDRLGALPLALQPSSSRALRHARWGSPVSLCGRLSCRLPMVQA